MFRVGDKVRLITKEELKQEKRLFVDGEGHICLTNSDKHFITLMSYEFIENQGKVFEIIEEDGVKAGHNLYRAIELSYREGIDCISEFALRHIEDTEIEEEIKEETKGITVETIQESYLSKVSANHVESPLEQARKIMESAVESINKLGITLEVVQYEDIDTPYLLLDSKDDMYVSKNVFGQNTESYTKVGADVDGESTDDNDKFYEILEPDMGRVGDTVVLRTLAELHEETFLDDEGDLSFLDNYEYYVDKNVFPYLGQRFVITGVDHSEDGNVGYVLEGLEDWFFGSRLVKAILRS